MNIHALSRSLAVTTLLLSAPAMAEQFGPLEISGFLKDEFSICDNCTHGLVNPSAYDPRGVLSPPVPMLNQGGQSGTRTANLALVQLTAGLSHEFDNAVRIEAKATGRMRNMDADIYDNWLTDGYVDISHPVYGTLSVGKMSSRSWSRADAFSYPYGLSVPWAESGAGYGVYPEAVRYTAPMTEIPAGKMLFEATYARASERWPLNRSSSVVQQGPPQPQLFEVFLQYAGEKSLVELIVQKSNGGRQSSFAKGGFYGAQGNTNGYSADYHAPSEIVATLQGNYWLNPSWEFTYGVKRSEWSGQAQQCDYGPVSPVQSDCFWDQPGFNYSGDLNKMYNAVEYDFMLGAAYRRQLWTYSLGGVHMGKASTDNPVEWGQGNTATYVEFSINRKMPEIYKNVELYANAGKIVYGRQGPAPLSMPGNIANGGVDPRVSRSGNIFVIGANFTF